MTVRPINTRRMAERVTRQLSDRLGERHVTAHHGSLAKERRLDAEQRSVSYLRPGLEINLGSIGKG